METFKEFLERHEACAPALKYARSLGFDVKAVIDNCPQADWLMWVVTQEPETFGLTLHDLVEYGLKAAEVVAPINADPRVRKPTQENIYAARTAWAAWARTAWAAVRHAWNATEDHPELRAQLWELVEPLKAKIKNHFTKTI